MSTTSNTNKQLETRKLKAVKDDLLEAAINLLKEAKLAVLREIAGPLVNSLSKYHYVYTDNKGNSAELEIFDTISKTPKKEHWVQFLAYFLCNENIEYFLDLLSANERVLWYTVAQNTYITIGQANKYYGKKCITGKGWRTEMKEELAVFFGYESSFYYYDEDYSFINFKKEFLYEAMFCFWEKKQAVVKELPKGLTLFSGEALFYNDFAVIEALHLGKKLKIGKNKLFTASIRKAVAESNLTEFFSEKNAPNEDSETMRGSILAVMYELITENFKNEALRDFMPEDWAKIIPSCLQLESEMFFPLFLFHFSGLRRNIIDFSYTDELIETINHLFCDYDKIWKEKECWIPFEQILYTIRRFIFNAPNSPYIPFCIHNNYVTELNTFNEFSGKYIKREDVETQFVTAAIKSMCFLFASWGILDIAHETGPICTTSPYDGLKYIRLTSLGRYVFGISKDYTPPVTSQSSGPIFELDNDRLLIKLLDLESPKRLSLDRFATAVTPTLYRVDLKTFIKECADKDTLEEKIGRFKRLMACKFSSIWEDFFETMRQQCQPLGTAGKSYTIRRISKDNKRLQEIIMTDERLKQYIVRAENYLILIENKNMSEVVRILRDYGYII